MSKKQFLEAIATLTGLVIGAGILGIPYVVARAGFLTGLINIVLIGLAVLLLNLYLGEIVLRTEEEHQLTGYAEKYLGKLGKRIMMFTMVFDLYGALIAYTVKEGDFLYAISSFIFKGNPLIYSLIFFAIMLFFMYKGFQAIEDSESLMTLFFLFLVIIIVALSFSSIKIGNLSSFNPSKIYFPYGVVLFAFLGTFAVPEMKKELKENVKVFKKAIIIGSLIPLVVYVLFALVVVGVTGLETTEASILGLSMALGPHMLFIGTLFGILTMATSFLGCGLALRDTYIDDFKLKKNISLLITCLIPLAMLFLIVMLKIENAFFKVLDFTGTLAGGLLGTLIVLMFWSAKRSGNRTPEYSMKKNTFLGIILIAMFLLGIVYWMLKIFRIIPM